MGLESSPCYLKPATPSWESPDPDGGVSVSGAVGRGGPGGRAREAAMRRGGSRGRDGGGETDEALPEAKPGQIRPYLSQNRFEKT